jgi:hypothetical protein
VVETNTVDLDRPVLLRAIPIKRDKNCFHDAAPMLSSYAVG